MGYIFFLKRFRPKELDGYKPYKSKDTPEPIPLNGKIIEGRIARYWNMTLSEFKLLSRKEQAESIGLYYIEQEIESYYNSEHLKRMDKK